MITMPILVRTAMMAFLLAGSAISQATIYKCPVPNGAVHFSGQPCNGAAAGPENEIQSKTYEVGSRLATEEQVKLQEKRRAAVSAKWMVCDSGDSGDSGDSKARYSDNLQPGTNKPAIVFTSDDEKQ